MDTYKKPPTQIYPLAPLNVFVLKIEPDLINESQKDFQIQKEKMFPSPAFWLNV